MNIAVGLMLPDTLHASLVEETKERGALNVSETCRAILGQWDVNKRKEKYGSEVAPLE